MKTVRELLIESAGDLEWEDVVRGHPYSYQLPGFFIDPVELKKMGDMDMQVWYRGRQVGIISRDYGRNVNHYLIGGPKGKGKVYSKLHQAIFTILKNNRII